MRHDIRQFEKLLKQNSRSVMGDPFIRAYIEDLLKNIRTQVLLKVITPYTRISVTARQRRPQTPPQRPPACERLVGCPARLSAARAAGASGVAAGLAPALAPWRALPALAAADEDALTLCI